MVLFNRPKIRDPQECRSRMLKISAQVLTDMVTNRIYPFK